MPDIQLSEHKLYYSISEVSKMFDVNPSLIRFWEKEFDIIHPKKNRIGVRQYTEKDIKSIELIYHLVKDRKYTLEGAKEKIKRDKKGEESNMEAIQRLQKIRQQLLDWKKILEDS